MEYEPTGYRDYSDTRPDLTFEGTGADGGKYVSDTKVFDSVGSDLAKVGGRGGAAGTSPLATRSGTDASARSQSSWRSGDAGCTV